MALLAAATAALTGWLLAPLAGPAVGPTVRCPGPQAGAVVALVLAVVVLVLPASWAAVTVVMAAAAWASRLLWRRRAATRLAEENAARVLEVCDLLAAELSAGRPAETALAEAAGAWPALCPVAEVARLGGDVPGALRRAALAPGSGGLRLLAAAWTVAGRTGGGLGAGARRVADATRREQAMRRVVSGELASARATARLMAALPLVALLMGSGAGADPWSFLLLTPLGLGCLAAGLAAAWAGLWWIEQIARQVDP
jgi:tight adherence protein B